MLKTSLQGLGANKTEKAIIKSSKVLGVIDPVLANFDSDNFVTNVSGGHQAANAEKDMQLILRQLQCLKKFWAHAYKLKKSRPSTFQECQ